MALQSFRERQVVSARNETCSLPEPVAGAAEIPGIGRHWCFSLREVLLELYQCNYASCGP